MKLIRQCLLVYILVLSVCFGGIQVFAEDMPSLHASCAVVLDGDTGRILYGKDEQVVRPMASTTKIMTLILGLENGQLEDYVTVSSYASKMPAVKLGIKEGEQYRLQDLLYAMILESYNDCSVAVAEHIGGNVACFARMMNEKAKEIGLNHTYFITPNGLDAEDEQGIHSTTAYDLALLMRYCTSISPQKDKFIEICQTRQYTFSDLSKKHIVSACNKNALLDQMDGVVAGKTGFTGNAGYCYVVAINRGDMNIVIALLACGWPSHKNYKWEDTRKLVAYIENNYTKKSIIGLDFDTGYLDLNDATKDQIKTYIQESYSALTKDDDLVEIKRNMLDDLLPVHRGNIVGYVQILVNDVLIKTMPIYAGESAETMDLQYYMHSVWNSYFF